MGAASAGYLQCGGVVQRLEAPHTLGHAVGGFYEGAMSWVREPGGRSDSVRWVEKTLRGWWLCDAGSGGSR